MTFGPGFVSFEPLGPILFELFQDLVIALSGVAKLFGCFGGAQAFTLAFHEHGKLERDFIIFSDGQRSCWAMERSHTFLDFDHRLSPPGTRFARRSEKEIARGSDFVK